LALAAVTPYILFSIYYLYADMQAGVLSFVETGGFVACLLIAYMGSLLVCIVIEGLSRRTFSKDEIIAEQRSQLTKSRDAIRRYMPPAVAQQIISGNEAAIVEPKRQRLTILFSDIVGFTDIADRVEPEVMTQIIGEYMAAMTEIIDAHHGTVNEFIGDGLMALFGAPHALDPETQARQAILSAQAMQAKLPELNHYWRRLGLGAALQIRTGINTGMVSVGSYGSQGRMTYTAIGLQTNIAARIQSHCEPGSVLISESTYHLVDDVIECEPHGTFECKGVHFPVKVYTPQRHKS
jgi:class 3 adenylate cyclase